MKSLHRLPASSLLEVTVATAILVLVFGLALGSLTRLALTGPRQAELYAQQKLAHVAAETIRQRAYHGRAWREGDLEIIQEVTYSNDAPRLLTLHLTAEAAGKPIAELNQLVYDFSPPATP